MQKQITIHAIADATAYAESDGDDFDDGDAGDDVDDDAEGGGGIGDD